MARRKKYFRFRKKSPFWGKTKLAKERMAWALWRIRRKKRPAPDLGQGFVNTFDSTLITFDSTLLTMDNRA